MRASIPLNFTALLFDSMRRRCVDFFNVFIRVSENRFLSFMPFDADVSLGANVLLSFSCVSILVRVSKIRSGGGKFCFNLDGSGVATISLSIG